MSGKMKIGIFTLTLIAGLDASVFAQQSNSPPPPPPGPGLTLIGERCSSCHNTSQVFGVRKPALDWAKTVQAMIDRGADLDPDEQETVVAYLASNFTTPAAKPTPTPHP
ncbi:MAG: hypothetical protein J7485_07900 [Sphingobium sp.]|nr:hypothetical protein [Sphingobium sp.]